MWNCFFGCLFINYPKSFVVVVVDVCLFVLRQGLLEDSGLRVDQHLPIWSSAWIPTVLLLLSLQSGHAWNHLWGFLSLGAVSTFHSEPRCHHPLDVSTLRTRENKRSSLFLWQPVPWLMSAVVVLTGKVQFHSSLTHGCLLIPWSLCFCKHGSVFICCYSRWIP